MVKVAKMDIPPAWQPLLDKILAYYDNQIYPTWASRYFHKTRSAKKRNKQKTYIPSAAAAWKALTSSEKVAWTSASAFGTLNNYQLFLADFSYRRKNGLSLPGTPFSTHEMMGLEIQNPGGSTNVRLRRDEKDLVGPITIAFTYQKTENAPTGDKPFKFIATAYYFWEGKNLTLTKEWSAPTGNVSWTSVSESFGVSGQKYFHLTIIWYLDNYDAIVDLDHLLIQSAGTDKYRECWQYKAGKTWSYDNLYRKTGWLFTPGYQVPYFDVIYLG
jgi:hypothetical protein